jgi:hypothetical protein
MRDYGPTYKSIPEDVTQCVESVPDGGRMVTSHQCRNARGHGKDGLYCAQHAKQYPVNDGETWYAVDVYLGRNIKPVTITHSTDSFVWVAGGSRSRKEQKAGNYTRYFQTEQEAITFCLKQAEAELKKAESDVIRLSKEIERLTEKQP